MAEKPFVRAEAVGEEELADVDENELANVQGPGADQRALMQASGSVALGAVGGDQSGQGMQLPRLQMVFGVGDLVATFSPGDLILAKENLLAHKGQPVSLIILSAFQYWKEYLSSDAFNAGMRPRSYPTEAEVIKAHTPEGGKAPSAVGLTQWGPAGSGVKPTFSPAMDLKMLIERPEGVICGLFGIEIGGKSYAPAVWTVDKTTYGSIGPVVKAAAFSLQQRSLLAGIFSLVTTVRVENGKTKIKPTLRLTGYNAPEVVEQIKKLFVAPAAATC